MRGAALFGVLVVNLVNAFRVSFLTQLVPVEPPEGLLDRAAAAFVQYVLAGKAVTLFAFLFGLGLAVQWERMQAAGRGAGRLARRLLVLLAFGTAHLTLVWNGDILTEYALVGLFLLPLLGAPDRTLRRWAVAFLVVHLALPVFAVAALPDTERLRLLLAEGNRVYGSGTWSEVREFSLREWQIVLPLLATLVPQTFALFIAGVLVWRRGIFQDPGAHRPFLARTAAIGIALGALATALAGFPEWMGTHPVLLLVSLFSASLAPLVLAMGYGAALLLAFQTAAGARLAAWLAPAGRMAFTNYIVQSLVFSWVFFGYGLGLYNRMGAAVTLGFGISFFAAQMAFSAWWLSRHRYGPLEWLWRTLTYGRVP